LLSLELEGQLALRAAALLVSDLQALEEKPPVLELGFHFPAEFRVRQQREESGAQGLGRVTNMSSPCPTCNPRIVLLRLR
jgi:hypothetical protein